MSRRHLTRSGTREVKQKQRESKRTRSGIYSRESGDGWRIHYLLASTGLVAPRSIGTSWAAAPSAVIVTVADLAAVTQRKHAFSA